jgi:hypothetical protein
LHPLDVDLWPFYGRNFWPACEFLGSKQGKNSAGISVVIAVTVSTCH